MVQQANGRRGYTGYPCLQLFSQVQPRVKGCMAHHVLQSPDVPIQLDGEGCHVPDSVHCADTRPKLGVDLDAPLLDGELPLKEGRVGADAHPHHHQVRRQPRPVFQDHSSHLGAPKHSRPHRGDRAHPHRTELRG